MDARRERVARGATGKEGRERQLLSLPSWMRGRGEGASALIAFAACGRTVFIPIIILLMLMLFAIL